MTLQVKILLSYLALGGGAGGIYLGANGGFGNSATEGVVEISEPDSNTQLVVANPTVEEPTLPAEKPQNVEVPVTGEKEGILVKGEITPEVETNERVGEETLTSDEKTEQTEASNNKKDEEPKPVLELQVAEEAPAPQPKKLKANIPSSTPEKAKESKGSASIKEPVSKQPTPKIEKSSHSPQEEKNIPNSNSKEAQCPDQSNQKGRSAFVETMSIFSNGQSGME